MARKKAGEAPQAPEGTGGTGFDARLERLERIVAELEDGELGLEESIARYTEGVALLRGCRDELEGYRRQVEELSGLADEALRPYAGDPDVEAEP